MAARNTHRVMFDDCWADLTDRGHGNDDDDGDDDDGSALNILLIMLRWSSGWSMVDGDWSSSVARKDTLTYLRTYLPTH